jgi:hypothetical protein
MSGPPSERRRALVLFLALTGMALAVRLLLIMRYPDELGDDAFAFVREAGDLLAGHLGPRPPKYPVYLFLLAALRGILPRVDPHLVGRLLAAVAASVATGVLGLLGLRLAGALPGALAGAYLTFVPLFLWNSASTSVEPLFILCVVTFVTCLVTDRFSTAVLVAALSCGVRYEGFALLGVAFLLGLDAARRGAAPWRRPALVATATGVVIACFPLLSLLLVGDPWRFWESAYHPPRLSIQEPEQFALRAAYPLAFYYLATPIIAFLAVCGTLRLAFRRERAWWPLFATAGALWLFQGVLMVTNQIQTEMRYLLYAGCLLMLPAGMAAVDLGRTVIEETSRALRAPARVALAAAFVVLPVAVEVRMGDEICRRARTIYRTDLALADVLAAQGRPRLTVAMVRSQIEIVRAKCAAGGVEVAGVPLDFIRPGEAEEALISDHVDYVAFARGNDHVARLFPRLDGGCPVESRGLRFTPAGRVPVEIVPAAHLAPGTYPVDASILVYRVER